VITKCNTISFAPADFRAPTWCFNGHLHTIGSSLLRRSAKVVHKKISIDTPDGDFVDIDWKDQQDPRAVIILLHGLEGSSERYYIRDFMEAFSRNNYAVLALNFRGCSGRLNTKRRFYHSGETGDLRHVIRWIKNKHRNVPVFAAGFSLGGNVLLKYLGEEGQKADLDGAVAISVPYDLKQGSLAIGDGFNKVYEQYFLRTLTAKLAEKKHEFPDLPSFTGKSLYDFDDQVTSILHGFEDAEDYYESCSSKHFVEDIEKPALLIHAKDDPLCRAHSIPFNIIHKNPYLNVHTTKQGGHVGFWSKPQGWLRQTAVDYCNKILA